MNITTNHVPRATIDAWELTDAERAEFDYIDWPAVEAGSDSATFFRYKGHLYDTGDFMTTHGIGAPETFAPWDGYQSDSFFSGLLIRYTDDNESVIVGTYYS